MSRCFAGCLVLVCSYVGKNREIKKKKKQAKVLSTISEIVFNMPYVEKMRLDKIGPKNRSPTP